MRARLVSPRMLAALALLGGACAAPQKRADESAATKAGPPVSQPASQPAGQPLDDRATLARLEREARALARTDGCSSAGACRTAPVGWRGCGGPRTYIVYCAATTDSAALFAKLEELRKAELAYNEKSGMMSTCEMRLPPTVTLQGGRCTESSGPDNRTAVPQ